MRWLSVAPDGPSVAAIGSGEVSLSIASYRGIDPGEVARALHEAFEAGLMLVDVAAEAAAENLVGEVVREARVRDRAVVACRIASSVGAARTATQKRVEDALRATRLEAIPLAQLEVDAEAFGAPAIAPRRNVDASSPELWDACARMVREGKVLRWGAIASGAWSGDAIARLVERLDGFATLACWQVPFSACERAFEPLVVAAASRGLGVLARRPLAGGALAGELGPGVHLRLTDDRRVLDEPGLERIAVAAARLATLVKREPPAARSCDAARREREAARTPVQPECATLAELALRFVIDHGAIALPRLHRREHIPAAVAAAAAPPLPADHMARLDGLLNINSVK